MYDVLRDNIGLLQHIYEQEEYYYEEDYNEPITEGILDMFKKKPTRWQRFKNFVGRNKGKIAAGAIGLGAAGWTGRSRYNYNKALTNARNALAKDKGWNEDKKDQRFWKYKDDTKKDAIVSDKYGWNPLKGYGDQKLGLKFYDIKN